MIWRIIIFLILCVTIIPIGHNTLDLSVGKEGLITVPPTCVVDDVPIPYIANREVIWDNAAVIGITDNFMGVKSIFFDPYALTDAPLEFQYWVLVHECGHHAIGHTNTPNTYKSYIQNTFPKVEQEADEYAINRLIKMGVTDSQIRIIYNQMKDVSFAIRHMSSYQKVWMYNDEKNVSFLRKELNKRAEHFLKCIIQQRIKQYQK